MDIRNGIGVRASLSSAAGLYVPWVSGDSLTTVNIGSTNSSNNQTALTAASYSGTGISSSSSSSYGVSSSSDTGTPLLLTYNKGGTSSGTFDTLVISANADSPTTVPAADFKQRVKFQLESTTTKNQDAAYLITGWKTATHASRTAYFSIQTVNNGSSTFVERARFGGPISTNSTANTSVNEISGNTIIAGNIHYANGIEIGGIDGGGSRNALIDFHSQDGSDFDFRVIRNSGANGDANLAQQGTGNFVVNMLGGGGFYFQNNSTTKFHVNGTGYTGIGTTADPNAFLYIQHPNTSGGWPVYVKNSSLEHLFSIDWTGNVAVYGGHSSSGKFYVNAGNTFDANIQFFMKSTSGSVAIRVVDSSSNIIMQLTNAGALSAVSYSNTSDIRIKKNIRNLTLVKATDILLKLKPVVFDYKDDHSRNQPGFIAQDLQEVVPEIVTDVDGLLGYQPTSLIPILVSVVQGLIAQNKSLTQRILKLESKE